jgi:hypothetical protein
MTPEQVKRGPDLIRRVEALESRLEAVSGSRIVEPRDFVVLFEDFVDLIPKDMQARWRAELAAHIEPQLAKARAELEAL